MKLNEIMKPEVFRLALKKNRGKGVKKLVNSTSKAANPMQKGSPYNPSPTTITGADVEQAGPSNFSGIM